MHESIPYSSQRVVPRERERERERERLNVLQIGYVSDL